MRPHPPAPQTTEPPVPGDVRWIAGLDLRCTVVATGLTAPTYPVGVPGCDVVVHHDDRPDEHRVVPTDRLLTTAEMAAWLLVIASWWEEMHERRSIEAREALVAMHSCRAKSEVLQPDGATPT